MGKEKTVSCVIPAHNEDKSILATLKAVSEARSFINEIIVVDDGSTDKTREFAGNFKGIKLLVNEKNLGKSGSIARGISESIGDYILLLDADLIGLNPGNIISLVTPIKRGLADVVISMRANTPGWMKTLGVDCMSGERILPSSVLKENLREISNLHSFGLEVFLNRLIIKGRLKIKTVMLGNIKNPMKWHKRSLWRGIKDEILMWRDLFRTVSIFEFISQQKKLAKLLVKNDAE